MGYSSATNGTTGTNGVDGKSLRHGPVDPTPSDGVNGEYFINDTSHHLFGPKAEGAWPAGVSLVGSAGGSVISKTAFLLSPVDMVGPVATEAGGSYTTGSEFFTSGLGVMCAGVRFFGFAGKTYKLSLWDSSGVRLATVTVTMGGGNGINVGVFGAPIELTPYGYYRVGIWRTDGGGFVRSVGFPTPFLANPYTAFRSIARYAAGDADPFVTGGTESYPVEPVLA